MNAIPADARKRPAVTSPASAHFRGADDCRQLTLGPDGGNPTRTQWRNLFASLPFAGTEAAQHAGRWRVETFRRQQLRVKRAFEASPTTTPTGGAVQWATGTP